MTAGVSAELLMLRKRASTWILLGIWAALGLVFAYVVPYVTYLNDPGQEPLADLLPQNLVGSLMGGFPFFGGVLALMLGVLAFGSEYGWGTLKTLLTQRPGRLRVFAAKMIALAIALVLFVLVVFGLGALASYAIALREGADVDWPSAWLLFGGSPPAGSSSPSGPPSGSCSPSSRAGLRSPPASASSTHSLSRACSAPSPARWACSTA
jgi:ABC-2 type transport system permease protein